jgi:predicted  nucleic acid-binding Zn-ribbon protein
MKNISDQFKKQIKELKKETKEQRKKINSIQELVKRQIEREPGIWEYDFDELEAEIWNKHSSIDTKIKELSDQISEYSGKRPKDIFRFFKNLRGNFIRQNVINQELISFYLAVMLNLQKVKDRLNSLEFKMDQINRERQDLMTEIQEHKSRLAKQREDK